MPPLEHAASPTRASTRLIHCIVWQARCRDSKQARPEALPKTVRDMLREGRKTPADVQSAGYRQDRMRFAYTTGQAARQASFVR